jgi:hypothetical protein
LLRREFLHPRGEDNATSLTRDHFVAELWAQGIDPTKYPSWQSLDDLCLVANAVKHTEGASLESLKSRRPELFTRAQDRDDPV